MQKLIFNLTLKAYTSLLNECRNQCVGPVEAAKLIANKGATVSQLLIFSHTM